MPISAVAGCANGDRLHRTRPVYHPALVGSIYELPASYVSRRRRELQAADIGGQQLRHLLRFDDRTISAHGMENRLPFLDYRMVEFAYRLPWKFKIRHGWTKYLIRLYLARHLSPTIAWRKKKLGFSAAQRGTGAEALVRARGDRLEGIRPSVPRCCGRA